MTRSLLNRVLEPEVMDSDEDAHQYDAMDHAAVNAQFVTDLLSAIADWSLTWTEPSRSQRPVKTASSLKVLDLGAGTAQIPIELARRSPTVHIAAVDAAERMLALARKNIAAAGVEDRIEVVLADAKHLPFNAATFPIVISNSIIHHIPDPRGVFAEAIRVTAPDGLLFHRDLARPRDETQLKHLVDTCTGTATPYQRKLFADSLRAALTLEDVQQLVADAGFSPGTVCLTSDRHWAWSASKVER